MEPLVYYDPTPSRDWILYLILVAILIVLGYYVYTRTTAEPYNGGYEKPYNGGYEKPYNGQESRRPYFTVDKEPGNDPYYDDQELAVSGIPFVVPPPPPPPGIVADQLVRTYDVETLANPFIPPTSRPADYIFGPTLMNPLFNESTHGPLDRFSYIGNLVEQDCHDGVRSESEDSSLRIQRRCEILRVMGRQKFARSDRYDYYVIIPQIDGLPIKIDLHRRRDDELYDGDEVHVPDLGNKKYRFKKNKSFFRQFY